MAQSQIKRPFGYAMESVLLVVALWILWQHPLGQTAGNEAALAVAIPLMAVAIVFPITLPSMMLSAELVFMFYFVLVFDTTTTLWANFFSELLAAFWMLPRIRNWTVALNPALKIVCLMLAISTYHVMEGTLFAPGQTFLKLLTVSVVYFLVNHLVLHAVIYLRMGHFTWQACWVAIKQELLLYFAVLPVSYLGKVIEPTLGVFTLVGVAMPVVVVTYLFRTINRLYWSNRVNETCVELSASQDMSMIYRRTFELAREMTDSPLSMLVKRLPDGDLQGLDTEGQCYRELDHPLLQEVIRTQKAKVITRAQREQSVIPDWQARSLILLPLQGKNEVYGIICLGKLSSYGYKQAHLSLLKFLASQVSMIIELNHVYEELERVAITNHLTGLYNYQYFYEQLDEKFKQAKAMGDDLSLVIFDIDYFKKYNDIYGHTVGDEVLRQVASLLKQGTEPYGVLLARYGGEEFVAIGELSLDQAYEMAEDVRRRIEEHQFVYQEHTMKNITISIGIAHVEDHDAMNPNDLLEKADQALYWGAKEMGRNRTALYGSEYDQRLFVDSLTGLHTVYYLRRKLRSMCEHMSHFPIYFLLVDIRGMRRINERYGFEVGNQVLIDASYLLKNTMRSEDTICRYMDDEFLIVIKGNADLDIEALKKRIRDMFASHLFPMVGSTVTCDVGAIALRDADEQEHILEWVDATRRKHMLSSPAMQNHL